MIIHNTNIGKQDEKLVNFIWLFYFIQTLNISIKIVFPINDVFWGILSNIFMGILFIVLLLNFHIVLKKNMFRFLIFELVFVFLFISSYLMDNSGISILLEFALWTLAVSLPLAFVFYSIEDKKLFLANSIKYSRVILMLAVVSFYFMNDNQVYVISLSYSMLLPLIFIILRKDELKTRFDSILILLSVLTLILFGARGPLLGLGYAILIKVINDKRRFSFISLLRIFTIVLIVGIYIVYFNEINAYILKILDSFDIYARTFRKFLSGSFTDTTGRDDLWVYYIGLIKEKPLLGWGISGGWISRGDGPHNGIIDIYLAHGMVIGTLATIMFIYMLSLPFVDRSLRNNTVYIAYAAVNIPLLVSAGDLWIKFNLFIFVAVFIHITKKTKKKEKIVQTI